MSDKTGSDMLKPLLSVSEKKDFGRDEKIKQKKIKLSKKTVNVFRTTQRNNMDLTAIADNKAGILLSLNALMITFLAPTIFGNADLVVEKMLYIPIGIFLITCSSTMYMAAQVLKPVQFDSIGKRIKVRNPSPFFFGNFFRMEPDEYFEFIEDSLNDPGLLSDHLVQDSYYLGKRLGEKMITIRNAFNIFIAGVFLTLSSTVILIII